MLARKIGPITEADPAFASDLYKEVYTQTIDDSRKTSMGSGRILNLTSNARQDYESARYLLCEYFPKFIEMAPLDATRGFIQAMDGFVSRSHTIPDYLTVLEVGGPEGVVWLQPDYSHIWAHDTNPQFAMDGEALLGKFVAFLQRGPEPSVLKAVRYAVSNARLGVIWSRLFMSAANRGGQLAHYLWPFAWCEAFLVSSDTRKDAIDLVAADYLRRSDSERLALEADALAFTFANCDDSSGARSAFLRRLFSAIGEDCLVTEDAKSFVDSASSNGDNNSRLFRLDINTSAIPSYDWMDNEAQSIPANASLIAAIDAVEGTINAVPNEGTPPPSLPDTVEMLAALQAEINSGAAVDKNLRRRANNVLGRGVSNLVRSDLVSQDTPADIIQVLVEMIENCAVSEDPECDANVEEQFERTRSWGSPAARICAAEACLELCLRRPDAQLLLGPLIDRLMDDVHPAVRLNAATRLVRIWDIDRDGFWRRSRTIVSNERNRTVLTHFVTGVLGRVMWSGAENEVAELTLALLELLPVSDPGNAETRSHLVQIAALLWTRFDHVEATQRVEAWLASPVDHVKEVCEIIRCLSTQLIAGLRSGEIVNIDRARALAFFRRAVDLAGDELVTYGDFTNLSEDQIKRAKSAMMIIDHACQQLYFGSGAFKNPSDQSAAPVMTEAGRLTFFTEVAPILRCIGDHGGPHTIYNLVQLLDHLIETDPPAVFDLIAHALLVGGQAGGYQFEGLGVDLFVKLIGEYLADHKEIFDLPERRQSLIECLETFLAAGWPSARRLLYRLPELIQ